MIIPGYRGQFRLGFYVLMIICLLARAEMILALVLHPEGEPAGTWTDKPNDAVVGRWSFNASFVVVAPNWIITTRHQHTSPTTVMIEGVPYQCHYDPDCVGGPGGNADLRLIRLTTSQGENADLEHFVSPYSATDEVDREIRIGGYGRGREAELTEGIPPRRYGYTWGTGANYHNQTLRWCTNRIDDTDDVTGGYTSDILIGDFDGLGYPSSTVYEGIPAEYDSGGGWFINQTGSWFVAGLTSGVSAHGTPWPDKGESWFRYGPDPNYLSPDGMDAVRISSYADWIAEKIAPPQCEQETPGDLNHDCQIDALDLELMLRHWLRDDCDSANDWCDGADQPPRDHQVNLRDVSALASHWLECYWLPDWPCE